ncbi:MAG: hypothetical protein L6405_04815 [Actinomycetia bacterium]|nr:hypothetical protein [Actinomycetes bacterium]
MDRLSKIASIITIISFLVGVFSIVMVFLVKCETDKILAKVGGDIESAKANTETIIDELELIKPKEIAAEETEETTTEKSTETTIIENSELIFINEITEEYENIESTRVSSGASIKDLDIETLKDTIDSYIVLEDKIAKEDIKNPYIIIPSIYYNLALYSYYYAYDLDNTNKHSDAETWFRYSEKISNKGITIIYSYSLSYRENPDYKSLLEKLITANKGAKIQIEYWDNLKN